MPERTRQAFDLLPPKLRAAALRMPEVQMGGAEEIRLRVGQPLVIHLDKSDAVPAPDMLLTNGDLSDTLTQAAQGSAHLAAEQSKRGFFTAQGGHRVGLSGSALVREGEIQGFRELSSVCVRIARQVPGIADKICEGLWCYGPLPNVLVLSPPGYGKTTFLREMIRCISRTRAVSLADDRGEVAGMVNGSPSMDIGDRTDVLTGAPKAKAALSLLRSMAPQVIAMDEITDPEDVRALITCAGCGVSLLCTAHAASFAEFSARETNRPLAGLFHRTVVIGKSGGARRYTVEAVGRGDRAAC
ncbi:MAG: stage III sporulation protein AB [Oscillospiraceae bacterium]|jgi:stage III sporulation protein AA|nr:stage III sporulation protein AB [Oscillospiraceae bacterium]